MDTIAPAWLWLFFVAAVLAAVANTKALEFLTGYLVEKSLAVDNVFVFLMIFTYFAVPPATSPTWSATRCCGCCAG